MKFNVRIVFCLIDSSSSSSVSCLKQTQSLFSDYTLYFSTAALDCLSCNHANTIDQCHKTPCAADEVSYTFDLEMVDSIEKQLSNYKERFRVDSTPKTGIKIARTAA